MEWVKSRLRERSTWAGIIGAATALAGINLLPEHADVLITLGVLIAGGAAVATKERRH